MIHPGPAPGIRPCPAAIRASPALPLALAALALTSPAFGGPDDAGRARAGRAGGDPPRPLGDRPHLRPDRGRPVLRPGVQRRPRPPVPARTLAAAGDRDAGRDPGGSGPRQRPGGPPAPVPGRPGRRAEPLSPPRGAIIGAFVRGINAYIDATERDPSLLPRRVPGARHQAGPVDARGRRLAAQRPVPQRHPGGPGGPAGPILGEDRARDLLNLHPGRPRLDARPGARPQALGDADLASYRASRAAVRFRPEDVVPAYRGPAAPATRSRREDRRRGDRDPGEQQLGPRRHPDRHRRPDHGQRPAPDDRPALAPLLGPPRRPRLGRRSAAASPPCPGSRSATTDEGPGASPSSRSTRKTSTSTRPTPPTPTATATRAAGRRCGSSASRSRSRGRPPPRSS